MTIWAYVEPEARATNRRRAPRQRLRLEALGTPASGGAVRVAIRDMSLQGFLIETGAHLLVGEQLEVDLPQAGPVRAEVIWSSGKYFGCRFEQPISKVILSAALLRSEPKRGDNGIQAGELGSADRIALPAALGLMFLSALLLWVALFWLIGLI